MCLLFWHVPLSSDLVPDNILRTYQRNKRAVLEPRDTRIIGPVPTNTDACCALCFVVLVRVRMSRFSPRSHNKWWAQGVCSGTMLVFSVMDDTNLHSKSVWPVCPAVTTQNTL